MEWWVVALLLLAVQSSAVKNCHPGCHCEVESFGLFDSFSLTKVDCRGLGPSASMPIPIPLDTAHLDMSSNAMGPLSDTVLAGPGYTTLISLDLSSNHITKISPSALSKLRYLESLDLSHNNLESLSPNCFSGLPLVEVDLSHNSFQEFDMDVFASKVNGEPVSVDLSHNKLVSVSTTLHGRVLHIQSLTLSSNQLSSVPSLAGLLLRYLNLDGNPITQIPEGAFAHLRKSSRTASKASRACKFWISPATLTLRVSHWDKTPAAGGPRSRDFSTGRWGSQLAAG
uniref:Tsukushi small leucine rich proteoglycan homolog (Xenopus laevis) n=1 Tax=Amphilophus citrinellus TaxID=61819 RepID=A0A3Q0SWQ7_AMPCI